jgi:hypothetical protein
VVVGFLSFLAGDWEASGPSHLPRPRRSASSVPLASAIGSIGDSWSLGWGLAPVPLATCRQNSFLASRL